MPTFEEVLDDDTTLDLQIRCTDGVVRTYSIQECSALQWGLMLDVNRAVYARTAKRPVDKAGLDALAALPDDIRAINNLYLGEDVATAMITDGVPQSKLQLATVAAQTWHVTGSAEKALAAWSGKARQPSKIPSDRTGDEDNDQPKADTSSTTTPQKSSPRGKPNAPRARRSSGARSSPTGG